MTFEIKEPVLVVGLGGAGIKLASEMRDVLDADLLKISQDKKDVSEHNSIHISTKSIINPSVQLIRGCAMEQSEKIEEFVDNASNELGGNLDCIVNNAGITQDNLSIRMSLDEWKKVIDINLTSTFLLSKFAIKKMLKNKFGKIINITSVVGHSGNIGQANYAASKAGIIAMSKSLALEYGKKNITVNCVSPGFIMSEMTDKISKDHTELLKSRISLNKFGNPEDVANTIAFLSSNLSDYITGETIHVNGGMYMA